MGSSSPPRDWTLANEYREANYGRCVVCGRPNAELAHIVGREHDRHEPLEDLFHPKTGVLWWKPYLVAPSRVVLLCGPATSTNTCHGIYDGPESERAQLNLIARLTMQQQLQAVKDAGGIYQAHRRITGMGGGKQALTGLGERVTLPGHL